MTKPPGRRSVVCAALALTLSCGHAAVALGRDFAWKVTGPAGSLYLVGSVHLLMQDFYPLSPTLDRTYRESDLLVEEVDLAEMLDPKAQMLLLTRGMLPANQSLDTVISPGTYAQVSQRVANLGMPIEPLKRFKPWSLALMLTALEWQKAGFDGELGLDKHFYDRARKDGKPVQGLETAEYQVSRFDTLSQAQQERMLAEVLKGLDTEMANITRLVTAWKNGDAATVEQLVIQDLKDDPEMYDRLLVERNRNWMPKLEPLLKRPGRALVVVGAAHLIGPDGLLAMLKARGYQVEQM
jgi:uncharacterized protein YbaP (TraB family)